VRRSARATLRTLKRWPETLVACSFERSLEMLWHPGRPEGWSSLRAHYAANPQERIAFVLTDAKGDVLLTQRSLLQSPER